MDRLFKSPFTTACCIAGLLSIMALGGCPAPQTPSTPDNSDDLNDPAPTNPQPTPDDDIDRPIVPPALPNDGSSDPGPSQPTTPGAGGGDNPGAGAPDAPPAAESIFIGLNSPADPLTVRPGAVVEVAFELIDLQGSVEQSELVVARDDDGDGEADGAPIFSLPINAGVGSNSFTVDTNDFVSFLNNGFGRFVVGARSISVSDSVVTAFAPATITVDAQPPTATWVGPTTDNLVNRNRAWDLQIETTDNSPHTLRILLDADQIPLNGNEFDLVPPTQLPTSSATRSFSQSLLAYPAGTYFYYVTVTDGIDPTVGFYAPGDQPDTFARLRLTNRLIGEFDLEDLTNSDDGAIAQGFNFNDLAGSSMAQVPSLDGDAQSELIIASRFGKPFTLAAPNNGVGFGEAYLLYGNAQRLKGQFPLNAAGAVNQQTGQIDIPGTIFPGIRTPLNVGGGPLGTNRESLGWTYGLSDVKVIDDMDGDDLPELAFSFPRVESITLGETDPAVQHPELLADIPGMGNLEFNAFTGGTWAAGNAQFTRGGVVIVSSHDAMMTTPNQLNRKANRVIDLHEVGQIFNSNFPPNFIRYINTVLPITDPANPYGVLETGGCIDCDGSGPPDPPENPEDPPNEESPICGDPLDGLDTEVQSWLVLWDVFFENQPPGGFLHTDSFINVNPPLANVRGFPFGNFPFTDYPDVIPMDGFCPLDSEVGTCLVVNDWWVWGFCMAGQNFPGGDPDTCAYASWQIPGLIPRSMWTGFYGPQSAPIFTDGTGQTTQTAVGARILGQTVEDQFGTALGTDGTWLYISAPKRTANMDYPSDVPSLGGERAGSGIVYQLRTDSRQTIGGINRAQLWIEPGTRTVIPDDPQQDPFVVQLTYPNVDAELPNRTDYSMPVPHTYVIEVVGSLRVPPNLEDVTVDLDGCPPAFTPAVAEGTLAPQVATYLQGPSGGETEFQYPSVSAGNLVDRTPQIVGPHEDAEISFVRGLGDINNDGVNDFAVGSDQIKDDVINGTGATVGAVFIVYGRPTGVEGDYLLEQLAAPIASPERLNGVLLRGSNAGETLARVFGPAGDVNGDGIDDVIVGNEGFDGGRGEAIVLFGDSQLLSPAGGWTVADLFDPANPNNRIDSAIRFVGAAAGDLTGANVSTAGDVDGDGFGDLLIAAPNAVNADGIMTGAVYLVYGAAELTGEIDLSEIGTVDLPGVKFWGRNAGDQVGGGAKVVNNVDPDGNAATVFSQGMTNLGDVDGDGAADFAISAMLADPGGKTDAGEVYILYGRQGP